MAALDEELADDLEYTQADAEEDAHGAAEEAV